MSKKEMERKQEIKRKKLIEINEEGAAIRI